MNPELILNNSEQRFTPSPEDKTLIELYKSKIDLSSPIKVFQYGAICQNRMVSLSEEVLRKIHTNNTTTIDEDLDVLVILLESFDKVLKPKKFLGLFESSKNKTEYIKAEFLLTKSKITDVEIRMERHHQTLLKDVHFFESLYQDNQTYLKDISLYIYAGEEKLVDLQMELSSLEKEAFNNTLKEQTFKDFLRIIERFEKRLTDLRLSRMISIQLTAQIRLLQDTNLMLIEKIQASIVNTIPLWKNQIGLSLGIVHSQQALRSQQTLTRSTNRMMENSSSLRESAMNVAYESEKNNIDISHLQRINAEFSSSIKDLVRIQQENRYKRLSAEAEIYQSENSLRSYLSNN